MRAEHDCLDHSERIVKEGDDAALRTALRVQAGGAAAEPLIWMTVSPYLKREFYMHDPTGTIEAPEGFRVVALYDQPALRGAAGETPAAWVSQHSLEMIAQDFKERGSSILVVYREQSEGGHRQPIYGPDALTHESESRPAQETK